MDGYTRTRREETWKLFPGEFILLISLTILLPLLVITCYHDYKCIIHFYVHSFLNYIFIRSSNDLIFLFAQ